MKRRRISESAPVQVYLAPDELGRLERLADQLGTTRSDVIRRALLVLERDTLDPDAHPALRLIGLAPHARRASAGDDPARDHDTILAETEEASWTPRPAPTRRPRGR